MALSFSSVEKAYKILNIIQKDHLPELRIPSWPEDMELWDTEKQENPPTNIVTGWGKKYDNGWENLMFFIESPSKELIDAFNRCEGIGNTRICKPYVRNKNFHVIGWF